MPRKRRAAPRAYSISDNAKPKRIRPSNPSSPDLTAEPNSGSLRADAVLSHHPPAHIPVRQTASGPTPRHNRSFPSSSVDGSRRADDTDADPGNTQSDLPFQNPNANDRTRLETTPDAHDNAEDKLDGEADGDTNAVVVENGEDGGLENEDDDTDSKRPLTPADDDAAIIFQCAKCRTLVADTATGFHFDDDCRVVSIRGACAVDVSDQLNVSRDGPEGSCTYLDVTCSHCHQQLGRVYNSTEAHFDHRRGIYTFDTNRLLTHRLGDLRTPDGDDASLSSSAIPLMPSSSSSGPSSAHPSLEAFEDLDSHVNTVTNVVNNITDAVKQSNMAIMDIREKLENTNRTVADGETAVSQMHNVLLLLDRRATKMDVMERSLSRVLPAIRALERRVHVFEKSFGVPSRSLPRIGDARLRSATPTRSSPASPKR